MGRRKEPIDLIVAKNKTHMSKEDIEARRKQEIQVPFKTINPPDYLKTKKQKETFVELAKKLLAINIYSELDADTLGRYIVSQDLYIKYTEELNKLMKSEPSIELMSEYQKMQDRAFKQAQSCARELGLTVSSRCRMIVPETNKETPKENKFAKFQK